MKTQATNQKLFLVNVTASGIAVIPVMANSAKEALELAAQANTLDIDCTTNFFQVDSVDDGSEMAEPVKPWNELSADEQWAELRRLDNLCTLYNYKARAAKGLAEKLDWHKKVRETQAKRNAGRLNLY
ncbi:MAG: hypothetical protein NVS3B25_18980 [Hymenobacter sp.]